MTIKDGYSRAGALNTKKFLELLMRKLPFPIQSILVDGGSEFMSNFEDACKEYGIALYVIPPRTPELGELREALKDYLRLYNHFRPHQALKQETPVSYYQQYYLGAAEFHIK